MKKRKIIAFGEMFLLVVMSFAIAFLISEEVGVGSAQNMMHMQVPVKTASHGSGFSPGLIKNGFVEGELKSNVFATGKTEGWVLFNDGPAAATLENGKWVPSSSMAESTWTSEVITTPGGEAVTGWLSPDGKYAFGNGEMFSVGKDGTLSSLSSPPAGPETAGGGGLMGGVRSLFGGTLGGPILGPVLGGAVWGAIVGGLAWGIAKLVGLSDKQAKSIGLSTGAGVGIGTMTYFSAANPQGLLYNVFGANPGLWSIGIGTAVGVGVLLATYKKEKKEIIKFECLPWEAPYGGNNCDRCNEDEEMPCSLYRCKSLGQACDIVNEGTDNELCVWIHPEDTQAPKIDPWQEALSEGLEYRPDTSISPPNRGFLILDSETACMDPYTNFNFGVTASEPAQCKADFVLRETYDEMTYSFGTGLFAEEHENRIKVPNVFNEEEGEDSGAIEDIHNNGRFTLYIRCVDANGNGKDSAVVAFTFCVNEGPDTKEPEVVGTNIEDGSAVAYNQESVDIEVYTNEPAECKWGKEDKDFEQMENEMTCSRESYQVNAQLNYVCAGVLDGIKNRENNDFYFRCKDYSTALGGRNVMLTSHKLTLRGTEPLILTWVKPEAGTTIKASQERADVLLEAKTDFGADEGVATCRISQTGEEGSFFTMDSENGYEHSKTLQVEGGNYEYFFECFDSGGNLAKNSTTFNVFIDTEKPLIARAYRDANKLKIITNEPAGCVYSLTSCAYDFDAATEDTVLLVEDIGTNSVHYTDWNPENVYYIKCQDLSDPPQRPAGDLCTMVVQGSDF